MTGGTQVEGAIPSDRWQRWVPTLVRLWGTRPILSSVVLGAVLTILAWPSSLVSLEPSAGLDQSWRASLAMAAESRLPFGTHIVFTYGPLGFLTVLQLYFVATTITAYCFTFLYLSAIFGALVWMLSRAAPLAMALPMAYLVGAVIVNISAAPELIIPLVLAGVVALLSRSTRQSTPSWAWVALGAVGGGFILIKFSVGAGAAALLVVAVVFMGRQWWRASALLLLGGVPVFAVGWFATGNGISNLVPFVRSTLSIVAGYGSAMSIDMGRGDEYWLAAFDLVVVGAFAYSRLRDERRRVQVCSAVAAVVAVWVLFKEGFVRYDVQHDVIFFAAMPLLLVAFARSPLARVWLIPSLFGLTVIAMAAAGVVPSTVSDPIQSVRSFGSDVVTLVTPRERVATVAQARSQLRLDVYALPARMTALMNGATVDVDPWEQTVVWAYPGLRFDPLPVIQDYSAYTMVLDRLDVSYLRSSRAPRFILRQAGAVLDGRNPAFDPPATQLAMSCRYRQVAVNSSWELLERVADRCGRPVLLGRIATGIGRRVTVPEAPSGDDIVATFRIDQSSWSSIRAALFKPGPLEMVANGGSMTWRFVTGTAGDFHVMRPSAALGYAPQFMASSVKSFMFVGPGDRSTNRTIDVSFYAVAIRPAS